MPTAKRKATASPAASDDQGAALEIDQPLSDTEQPSYKRPNLSSTSTLQSSESTLRQLPLEVLEQLLPLQKRRCLETLVGGLPPIPAHQPPVASTSTLPNRPADHEDDEDAAVFTDTTTRNKNSSPPTNQASACVGLQDEWHTLHSMLHATVTREESNSCLLIGAAGCGKSLLVDSVLQSITSSSSRKDGAESKPYYHVHLAGTVQINDRSAMKEMAQQLILQGAFTEDDVGEAMESQSLSDDQDKQGPSTKAGGDDHVFGGDDSDEDNEIAPAVAKDNDEEAEIQDELAGAILSSLNNIIAHIIALLSNTSSTNPGAGGATGGTKPLVITLDDFDLFTARPRQAMLYCLLDAVQAASYGAGLAVVGLTSRVDTVDLLEKRVKSRFSHRILHVRPPSSYEIFERIVRNALSPLSPTQLRSTISRDHYTKFTTSWTTDVTALFNHPHIHDILRGIYELSNDIRMVYRVLTPAIAKLDLLEPTFDLPLLLSTASVEVGDGMLSILRDLTEPEMALLIAVKHLQTRDRSVFNFEMCYDELRRFAARDARERQAASTGSNSLELDAGAAAAGGGVLSGSAVTTPFYADRKIALMAFHSLLSLELLLPENYVSGLSISNPVAKPSAVPFAGQTGRANQNTIRKEFWKVRCILTPILILQAVKDRQRPVAVGSALVKWASSHG